MDVPKYKIIKRSNPTHLSDCTLGLLYLKVLASFRNDRCWNMRVHLMLKLEVEVEVEVEACNDVYGYQTGNTTSGRFPGSRDINLFT